MKGLILTYVMTYGGAAVSFVRPFYGFLIYVCFSIIKPETLWHWAVPPGNYSRVIAIGFLVGWVLNGFGNRDLGKAKLPALMLAGYWIWAVVSTISCEFTDVGVLFLENSGKIVLPALAGLTLINTRRDLYLLAWTITGSIGYVAYDLNRSFYDGFNRLQMDGFGGMDNNSMTIALVTGVGLAFFLGLAETTLWKRYLAFGLAAFMTNAVFFSNSRGGLLGLCCVGAATLLVIPRTPRHLGFVATGVIAAAVLCGPQAWERFSEIAPDAETGKRDWSAESRIELWKICGKMMMESPITGKGPDHFQMLVGDYGVIGNEQKKFGKGKSAHSLWMETGAELGFPGLGCLAGFYGLTILFLWPYVRTDVESAGLTQGATARMVFVALVGFACSAQFVSLEGLELPYYLTLVGLGALKLQPSVVYVPADAYAFASTETAI